MGEGSNYITLADVRVTPKAVQDKLNKLNPNKAQGPNQVPPRVLKELANNWLRLSVSVFSLINHQRVDQFQKTGSQLM